MIDSPGVGARRPGFFSQLTHARPGASRANVISAQKASCCRTEPDRGSCTSRDTCAKKALGMPEPRVQELIVKLERGMQKTEQRFRSLPPEKWSITVYDGSPPWTARSLLAHFASSEVALLAMAKNVASGGPGAPEGFDFDAFNAEEQIRLASRTAEELLGDLISARDALLSWLRALPESALDCQGRHPALGTVSLETMITAIYGHQLLHMRDLAARLA